MANNLVNPEGENLKPMMAGPMKPVKITHVIEAAGIVAGNRYHLDVGLAEDGRGTWHVARAGDEQKSL